MKKGFCLLFFNFFIFCSLFSQVSFLGFQQPQCNFSVTPIFSFTNYTYSSGPSLIHGYKLFRDGVQILDTSGSVMTSQFCNNLHFINDSVGFLVAKSGYGTYVKKTIDYGATWTRLGSSFYAAPYLGFYIINPNYAYLVTTFSDKVWIYRYSDTEASGTFISDPTMTTFDVFKNDTVFGNSICGVDSLLISLKNVAGDTINYHINWHFIPVGIFENSHSPKLVIFPNPASTEINLSIDDFIEGKVFSMDGKEVKYFKSSTVNISDLDPGIYILRIRDNQNFFSTFKFIKN